jgi:hypothetical protein
MVDYSEQAWWMSEITSDRYPAAPAGRVSDQDKLLSPREFFTVRAYSYITYKNYPERFIETLTRMQARLFLQEEEEERPKAQWPFLCRGQKSAWIATTSQPQAIY